MTVIVSNMEFAPEDEKGQEMLKRLGLKLDIDHFCKSPPSTLQGSVDLDKTIYHSISLRCSPDRAFELFTVNAHLERWLTEAADVEPKIGGKYELFWTLDDKENDSTIGCKILAVAPSKFLCFEWKGPRKFKHFMNDVRPLTHVVVSFTPHPEETEVHLLHTGWRDSTEWEAARQWFDKAWAMALSELENYVADLRRNNGFQ